MSSIKHVPWTTPPAAERHLVRTQWRGIISHHEPLGMLLEDMRIFLGDERRNPDRRLKAANADLFEHSLNVSAESAAGFQPVAHGGLITIVDLNVFEARRILRDEVEIVEDLLGRDARTEAIPGTPSSRRSRPAQRRMILNEPLGQLR